MAGMLQTQDCQIKQDASTLITGFEKNTPQSKDYGPHESKEQKHRTNQNKSMNNLWQLFKYTSDLKELLLSTFKRIIEWNLAKPKWLAVQWELLINLKENIGLEW